MPLLTVFLSILIMNSTKETSKVFYYANGDIYEGEFINDKRVGKGKMTFAD